MENLNNKLPLLDYFELYWLFFFKYDDSYLKLPTVCKGVKFWKEKLNRNRVLLS